jgi:hypothetical protein
MLLGLEASIIPAYYIRAGYVVSILELRILIPQIVFWLAAPTYYSSRGYRFFDCSFILARSAASLLK